MEQSTMCSASSDRPGWPYSGTTANLPTGAAPFPDGLMVEVRGKAGLAPPQQTTIPKMHRKSTGPTAPLPCGDVVAVHPGMCSSPEPSSGHGL